MTNSAPAPSVLDREFLELRARILELAAALDRLDREGRPANDPRLAAIARGIEVLRCADHHRAEQVQLVFSLPYVEEWRSTMDVRPR